MIAEIGHGPLVAGIAFFYSMVGWAGGSAYAALFSGAGLEPSSVKVLSLSLNVWVSAVGWAQFSRAGHFRPHAALPFAALSVPAAWLGAKVPIAHGPFLFLIGLCLAVAASRLLLAEEGQSIKYKFKKPIYILWTDPLAALAGAFFGFLSGLAGIGGGIFLTPFLILTRRATLKEAAAASSFFIFVNSLAGLWSRGRFFPVPPVDFEPLVFWALAGGILGSTLGSDRLPVRFQRGALAAFLLFFACAALSEALVPW